MLVWYEVHDTIGSGHNARKGNQRMETVLEIALIENADSGWRDLYGELS